MLIPISNKGTNMSISVYGISTCSTCKKALKWLDANGIEYTWIDTRKTPPSEETILSWISDIGFKPMRNTSGGSYRALGAEKQTWGDTEWCSAFSKDAMLLKRPLFEKKGKALFTGFRGTDEEIKNRLGS